MQKTLPPTEKERQEALDLVAYILASKSVDAEKIPASAEALQELYSNTARALGILPIYSENITIIKSR